MISMRSLWQEVQNRIPHISFETTFSKVLPVCANHVIKIFNFNFSAAISNIYTQFAHMNRGPNCECFMLNIFSKVFPVCANAVIKILKV